MFSWWCSADSSVKPVERTDFASAVSDLAPLVCPVTGAAGACPVSAAARLTTSSPAAGKGSARRATFAGRARSSSPPTVGSGLSERRKTFPPAAGRKMLADLLEDVPDVRIPASLHAQIEVCNSWPSVQALSEEDIVVVKGAWNRTLGWKDMFFEAVLYRWIRMSPDVYPIVESFFSEVPHDLFMIIDGSVRRLDPRTEVHNRESYTLGFPHCLKRDFGRTPGEVLFHYTLMGLRPSHWCVLHEVLMWAMKTHNPYKYQPHDGEDLERGPDGAVWRFFHEHIVARAHQVFLSHCEKFTEPAALVVRKQAADLEHSPEVGLEFYKMLLTRYPALQDYFADTDMDAQVQHLHATLGVVGGVGVGLLDVLSKLTALGKRHREAMVPTSSYEQMGEVLVETLQKFYEMEEEHAQFWIYTFLATATVISKPMAVEERLLMEAREFFEQLAKEQEWGHVKLEERMSQVAVEVGLTGTYRHTAEELQLGARMAWRNSPKCIGRIAWDTLVVRDCRHVKTPSGIFEECKEHLRLGANGGVVQSLMTVFAPRKPNEKWGTRFWNSQFCRYAGYRQPDGSVLGDPANVEFTELCINKLGWKPPQKRTQFDPLPQVIQLPDAAKPVLFDMPKELFAEIPLSHPKFPKFAKLGLKWASIPAITNFNFRLGGVDYPCCPFNGWFCDLEIARNLVERYDMGAKVAKACGFDTTTDSSGWRSMVLQATSCAVTHSFQKAKMSIVDHYSVSHQFLTHVDREKRCGREVPAQWSWIGGFAGVHCPVWGYEMRDFYLRPQYQYCCDRWVVDDWMASPGPHKRAESKDSDSSLDSNAEDALHVLVLHSSTTGTAERFAQSLRSEIGAGYRPHVMDISSFSEDVVNRFSHVVCCVSTFGDGGPPLSGAKFPSSLPFRLVNSKTKKAIRYAVLALGSSIYPKFCAFGKRVDKAFLEAGGVPFCRCMLSDEVKGHDASFKKFCAAVRVELPKKPPPPGMKESELLVSLVSSPMCRDTSADTPSTVRGHSKARVASVERVFDNPAEERRTHRIRIDISGCGDMAYETGGHLSVLPHNPHEEVLNLCDAMDIPREQVHWKIHALMDDGVDRLPADLGFNDVSLYEVLKWNLDISVRPATLGTLLSMVKGAGGMTDEEYNELLSNKHQAVGRTWWVSLLLNEYPKARGKISLATLLTSLGKQFARPYSIASSALISPKVVEVVVGLVCVQHRRGLASGMLHDLVEGSPVWVSTSPSSFRLPEHGRAPLIMVGAGTGVAPFLAFARERTHNLGRVEGDGQATGQALLFSGFRRKSEAVCPQEFQQALDVGALSFNSVSLTREPGVERRTVTDSLRRSAKQVWEALQNPECHYYCCGDGHIADSAHEALLSVVVDRAHISRVKAVKLIDQMRLEGRYHLDVWGVISHGGNATVMSQKRSSMVKKWLDAVKDAPMTPIESDR